MGSASFEYTHAYIAVSLMNEGPYYLVGKYK